MPKAASTTLDGSGTPLMITSSMTSSVVKFDMPYVLRSKWPQLMKLIVTGVDGTSGVNVNS